MLPEAKDDAPELPLQRQRRGGNPAGAPETDDPVKRAGLVSASKLVRRRVRPTARQKAIAAGQLQMPDVLDLSEDQTTWLEELLKDCESTTRLNDWEGNFVDGIRDRFLQHRERTRISPRQMEILRKIEAKVYA